MKQVQLPCCMGGVSVTVKNKWTNMSKNKRNFIITELLLGVLLVIAMGFIAYNKLNEKPERIAVVMADVDDERVIIRTKLEKPSKIKGLALI